MSEGSAFPPRLTVDTKNVLQLFTGERFYSSADAALREAILNAIDACGRRRGKSDDAYSPEIRLIFDDEALTLRVMDNGDGMSREDISNLFAKVGVSASDLFDQSNDQIYKAVGEFGIGIVSYFLIADHYEVHSKSEGSSSLGVEITREMLDGKTPAAEVEPKRRTRGTTLIMPIKSTDIYQRLVDRFSHWVRDVDFLEAMREPSGERIEQGGLSSDVQALSIAEPPDWLELATVGPPTEFSRWQHLDGRGKIDLLYRGVFVEEIEVGNLWGLEGALHVDPKSFKAKLNREGFIGQQDKSKITQYLKTLHPKSLAQALECVIESVEGAEEEEWNPLNWVNLWLAIPRNDEYSEAAAKWDNKFRDLKAFKRLLPDGNQREISVCELETVEKECIFVAPPRLDRQSNIVQQAVKVLRAENEVIIQGKHKNTSFLRHASYIGNSANEVLTYFSENLPAIERINNSKAQGIVRRESEAELFSDPVRVLAVRLGDEGAALVRVQDELWVNIDSEAGKDVVREVCDRN